MRYTLSQNLYHILRVTLFWFLAFLLFGFMRFYGTVSELHVTERVWASSPGAYVAQILLAAIVTGGLYGIVDLVIDRPKFQRRSFWRIVITKALLHAVIIVATLTALMLSRIRLGLITPEDIQLTLQSITMNKSYQVFVVFFILMALLLSAYQQVKLKFGRGVLLSMMLGRYHKPQEADRIFMFVDLKSSVELAEKLGHIHYSLLLQDCYFDLNTQLGRYKAKVYQYVGDQAVIHWTPEDGLSNNNCIMFFFAFIKRLERRREHYMNTYGFVPFFKAGAHMGRVTIAEVGLLKKSIAFHGDVVNTTSRIHDQCNNYGQQLLVSKDLLSRLMDRENLKYVYIGDEILKGKHKKMELYGIRDVS